MIRLPATKVFIPVFPSFLMKGAVSMTQMSPRYVCLIVCFFFNVTVTKYSKMGG